jgi:23S rRNA (pseudouridine1915-N3)-methyltransferase
MNIRILTVGKIKEKYFRDAIEEYRKRLGRYCTVNFIQVEDEKTPDGAAPALEDQIRRTEGQRLLKHLKEDDYVIALAIEGENPDSEEMARQLSNLAAHGKSSLVFVIGGSLGLSEEVLSRADWLLSFSRMTFPHQLMQVILLEQIYRSFRIMRNEPYHK